MTNNEIKKALKDLAGKTNCQLCVVHETCPSGICIFREALDLINRLEAENERLKEGTSVRDKIIDERGAEVIRHDNAIRSLRKQLETAKTEAYKEFVEKAKEELCEWVGADNSITYSRIERVLDNFVEEMEKKYNDNRSDN